MKELVSFVMMVLMAAYGGLMAPSPDAQELGYVLSDFQSAREIDEAPIDFIRELPRYAEEVGTDVFGECSLFGQRWYTIMTPGKRVDVVATMPREGAPDLHARIINALTELNKDAGAAYLVDFGSGNYYPNGSIEEALKENATLAYVYFVGDVYLEVSSTRDERDLVTFYLSREYPARKARATYDGTVGGFRQAAFGMTPEEVVRSEGDRPVSFDRKGTRPALANAEVLASAGALCVQDIALTARLNAEALYFFDSNRALFLGTHLVTGFEPERCFEAYDDVKAYLTDLYGEPVVDSLALSHWQMATDETPRTPEAVALEGLEYVSRFSGDGTTIVLKLTDYDQVPVIIVNYFDADYYPNVAGRYDLLVRVT